VAGTEDENHHLLVALKHPLRRSILRAMDGEAVYSPRELANILEESLSNVSYHVRVLFDRGALVRVSEQKVRGATQRFYRRSVQADWALKVLAESEDEPPEKGP
jgi:DNA-binding transcriptional ArsR family regulator